MCGADDHDHDIAAHVPDEGLRVVVVGKGGVGKSMLTAVLARTLARGGARVLAVDADEQRNLAATLGLDADAARAITAVSATADYIEEKTGIRPGEGTGGMMRMNPDTSDIVDRLAVTGPDNVRLLVMGGVQHAGAGCLCPENAVLAAVLSGMRLRRGEIVVMDTHAGVEHFGRALARGFEAAVVVVDPTGNSIQVGLDEARLASELGIGDIHLAINRSRGQDDVDRTLGTIDRLGGIEFASVHAVPFDERALAFEPAVDALLDPTASPIVDAVDRIAHHLLGDAAQQAPEAAGVA